MSVSYSRLHEQKSRHRGAECRMTILWLLSNGGVGAGEGGGGGGGGGGGARGGGGEGRGVIILKIAYMTISTIQIFAVLSLV